MNNTRTQRLRSLTREAHDGLDKRIMVGQPFASHERYGMFLKVQYHFHRDIAALYDSIEFQKIFPDIIDRRRLGRVELDLADLAMHAPVSIRPPVFSFDPDIASALGWLYVAEGSNLGAAFLLKEAARLDLTTEFGARHLAGHDEQGRGLHWRIFTSALDAIELNDQEEARVTKGGIRAFERVHELVEEVFE